MLMLAVSAWSQQYAISTVAGGAVLPTPVMATAVPVNGIGGVAADSSGNVYFTSSNCVFKLDQSGMLTRVAGNGRAGFSGDGGPAMTAQLSGPGGIAIDHAGNIFIADSGNERVRRISPSGVIATVAGGGTAANVDGIPATTAQFIDLAAIAVDASGDIFVSDLGYSVVRKVSPSGIIATVAGNGTSGYSGDGGPAVHARLGDPYGLAVDGAGNLYIADSENNCVRKVSSNGTITTFAGTGFAGFSGDGGAAASAQLDYPQGVALDGSGNLLIADLDNYRVRKVSANGTITTVAGNGTYGLTGDGGLATNAELTGASLAVDSAGNILVGGSEPGFFGDFVLGLPTLFPIAFGGEVYFNPAAAILVSYSGASVLRKISAGGTITTVAGNTSAGPYGLGGAAANAQFGSVQGAAVDSSGNIYIVDPADNYVLKVSAAGVVTAFAGNGTSGFSGDGAAAAQAQLAYPTAVTVDSAGNVFIADQDNGRIRKVSASGIITTVAGNGNAGYAGDGGLATSAEIARPVGVAVDGKGNLYLLDSTNSVVRKVSTSGIITTVAGNGSYGYSGDNGPAANAQLFYPSGIAVDAAGDIFIADTDNYRVREVSAAGTITTVAGTGYGSAGDGGPAASAGLSLPTGVAVDSLGNLFIGDGQRIRWVNAKGIINTIAGNGTYGNSGDGGPASNSEIGYAYGLSVDGSGNVFFADSSDNAVRKLTPTSQTVLISSVVDAASELASAVAPGKIISIYGAGLGPATGVTGTPSKGVFGTQLGGTTVSVNGVAAPVFYASATQVNAIVPYEISGTTATVNVAYQSGISAGFSVSLAASSPSFFSYNATGAGQAAAINVVDGTLNTAANPVKIGAYISFYATGEGQTTPAGVDGKLGTTPLPSPNLPVTVAVGGLPAVVQYKGGVSGVVAGLMQVNVQIPAGVATGGYVPVVLSVGTASTVNGAIWIAVSN